MSEKVILPSHHLDKGILKGAIVGSKLVAYDGEIIA